ncbi:eukaryotic translation initiation factor 3 subunit 6 interacting protein [Toxoplasma gondii MAS]|uniref:Eukaryotic translation initiation factor 3 subunit L n=1 Tax=Toxoplasma gondii MAS TaxID=943118 RepID=A0A086QWU2_TOXGO|nr:eukaryotic translation initiation factor 3 subunit 6 interacting protein [Toxoplasma gondii MAS]
MSGEGQVADAGSLPVEKREEGPQVGHEEDDSLSPDSRFPVSPSNQASQNVEGEGLDDAALDRMMGEKVRFENDVEEFLRSLYDEVYDRNVDAIRRLYEVEFPALTERYYAERRWPSVDEVGTFYRQFDRYHCLIITLYKELYYRHLFLKCQQEITWEDRRLAWENYALLINFLAEVECRPDDQKDGKSLRLPLQWLWDILDEFVYQFQEACRWRQRIARRLPEDEEERALFLKEMDKDCDVWKASPVLEFLHALVQRSEVQDLLRQPKDDATKNKLFESEIRFQLGYFAMILLLRLHVLMGDYFMGVKSVESIELASRGFYWKVPAAHVTLFYHLGFAYTMMRRYTDAIRVMSQLLVFVSRQRSYLSAHFYQQMAMNKAVDKMYILVMLCASLCNVKLDESVNQMIKEKYSDKFYKLQQENDETYCDLFTWACPKFINPATPSFEDPQALERFANSYSEVQLRQCKMFFKEVEFHKKISTINSFAKLYNNIQLSKLASLMELSDKDPEDAVRSEILSVKYKGRQKVWRSGSLLSGDLTPSSSDNSVEFYMDQDMIHVRSQQSQKVYVDQFLKQIERSQHLFNSIQNSARSGQRDNRGQGERGGNQNSEREKFDRSQDRRNYGGHAGASEMPKREQAALA